MTKAKTQTKAIKVIVLLVLFYVLVINKLNVFMYSGQIKIQPSVSMGNFLLSVLAYVVIVFVVSSIGGKHGREEE